MNKRYFCLILVLSIIGALARPAVSWAANLNLNPKKVSLNTGGQTVVTVRLVPQGEDIIGVDLDMRFDPGFIKIIDMRDLHAFSSQTGKIIDNSNGTVRYSLSNSYNKYQKNPVDIAEIVLEAKNITPKTYLTFDFISQNTRDTNVVVTHGRDALASVDTLEIEVINGSGSGNNPSPSPNPSSSPNVTPTPAASGNVLPETTTNPDWHRFSPVPSQIVDDGTIPEGKPPGPLAYWWMLFENWVKRFFSQARFPNLFRHWFF